MRLCVARELRDVPDKFENASFHVEKAQNARASVIKALPFALEYKVKSIEKGIFIGEIVNIDVERVSLRMKNQSEYIEAQCI